MYWLKKGEGGPTNDDSIDENDLKMEKLSFSNSYSTIIYYSNFWVFFPVIQVEELTHILTNLTSKDEGLGKMLTLADKGGGGSGKCLHWLT